MAYYRSEIVSVREFVKRKDLVTIPADLGPLTPVRTPLYLRPIVAGQAMEAPLPFDTTTVGTYFLGNTYPDSLTPENRNILYTRLVNRGARTGVLYEGIPGHHLQLSIAKHHGSAIRRYTHSTMLTEGW